METLSDYTINELIIPGHKLTKLPDDMHLYTNIKYISCYENKITNCDILPPNLENFYCGDNKIIQLDNLPHSLVYLFCFDNQITQLNNLPPTLEKLDCKKNPLQYEFYPSLQNIRKHIASLSNPI